MLDQIFKLLKILNSEQEPVHLSLGFAFAMVVGFTPVFSLHNLLVLLLILVLRVNLSAFFLGWAFFSALGYLLDPLFHQIGMTILQAPQLQNLWTDWYNSAFWRLTLFNNSIVMGSVVSAMLLFMPMLLLGNLLIRRYRDVVLVWLRKLRIVQILKASKWVKRYQALQGLRDA